MRIKGLSYAYVRILLLPFGVAAVACGGEGWMDRIGTFNDSGNDAGSERGSEDATHDELRGSMRPFASDDELFEYLQTVLARTKVSDGGVTEAANSPSDGAASPTASGSPNNETITNNQENGVDEGGIVKNVGDYLVTLRKGRLYATAIGSAGAPAKTDSMVVARSPSLNRNVWYDELLVRKDRIYVVGYRYQIAIEGENRRTGATEIDSFRLSPDGRFERLKSIFVESQDYFSSSNYTSRLIGDSLVISVPFGAYQYSEGRRIPRIPQYLVYTEDGRFRTGKRFFGGSDVFVPVEPPQHPVFHTVASCSLGDQGEFDCEAKALLGDWNRAYYVSPTHAYLWSPGFVYRLSLEKKGEKVAEVHRAWGVPHGQFSFKQQDDRLFLLATEKEGRDSKLLLNTLDLDAFDTYGEQGRVEGSVREIRGYENSNVLYSDRATRYIGGRLVTRLTTYENAPSGGVFMNASSSASLGSPSTNRILPPTRTHHLLVHDLDIGTTQSLDLQFPVGRVEALGEDRALLVELRQDRLSFSTLNLDGEVAFSDRVDVAGAFEGEWRSHGFFYRGNGDGTGYFGLPIFNPRQRDWGWFGSQISNLAFFHVDSSDQIAKTGVVAAPTDDRQNSCETSCIDWYGNTRPIFLGERVFALMGSALQEVDLSLGGATLRGEPAWLVP